MAKTPTRNPNSVRSARRVVAALAIGAFLLVDGVLVAAALSLNAAQPESMTPPLSATPLGTPGGRPSTVDLPPATRLLAAFDASTAWRAETGTCPKANALVEHTVDSGQTWNGFDLGVQGGISSTIRLSVAGDDRSASIVALTKQDCSATWVGTTTQGTEWTAFPDRVATAWHLQPGDSTMVVSPGGPKPAPCGEVVGLADLSEVAAAILCSDGSVLRTANGGTTWDESTSVQGSAAAIGRGPDGYLVATASVDPACVGLAVSAVPATGMTASTPISRCVETGNESSDLAISGNDQAIWVWAGTATLRSLNGGTTWQ
jgi:hypothetical protein